MTTPQIIAHRGASYLAPENTLVAFRKAMEIGADGVEMDVQKTYDNQLVIHHDYMVDMHTDISGQIYDLTMGELKALDFGSWKDAIYANERIATLQEALELCAGMEGTQVQLELKSPLEDDPDFVPRVLDAVRAAGLTDRLTLISFHHSQLRQAKQLMPELKVGALTYGAFLSMVLPPPVVWKDLGLVNSMDEPFSEENCIDLRNNLIYRTVADKVDMLRANFPGETVEQAVSRADKLMYQAKNHKNMVVTEDNARDGALSAAGRESHSRQSILIVDDSEMNRAILAEILGSDYNILEATNGKECLAMLEQYGTGIALILLDIVMPVMDGFAVLSEMNRSHWIEDIPVIMISSEDADTVVRHAYELGVSDYVSRPFDAGIVYRRVFNTIKLYAKQRRLASLVTSQIKEKEKNTKMMISILSEVVEFRNGESGQHVLHIGTLTQRLLERLTQKTDKYDLPPETQELIVMASALHDIGKVAIDDKILNKPGRLTPEEFDLMKTHTVVGANMLDHLGRYKNEALVKTAHDICRWHHERWDGRGYPDGLAGDDIPISAQIVSMADVYDALVSKRVYKAAYSPDTAVQMILHGDCGQFNPLLLECLVDIQNVLKAEIVGRGNEDS